MDIEKLITETFTAHEHVAPDGDRVLAATREHIGRGRTVSRPLAVAAGVAVLTVAAATVVALNRSGPTPEDNTAAPAASAGEATSSASADPAIADLRMPFSLGWLPKGSVEYLAQRINVGAAADDTPLYGGEYMLTVTADDGQVLNVDVQEFRMTPVEKAAFKSGPGKPVTINGQRGVESSRSGGPGGYELYAPHPEVGSMYVGVSAEFGSTAPAQQLVETGRRIAENIRFPGTTTVTPSFGLRDLPDGMRICAFDVEQPLDPAVFGSGPMTAYTLGACTTRPFIYVNTTNPNGPTGTAGRTVRGHATRYVNENGYHKLWVLDAVDNAPVLVAGDVPLAELYDIADLLILPR